MAMENAGMTGVIPQLAKYQKARQDVGLFYIYNKINHIQSEH